MKVGVNRFVTFLIYEIGERVGVKNWNLYEPEELLRCLEDFGVRIDVTVNYDKISREELIKEFRWKNSTGRPENDFTNEEMITLMREWDCRHPNDFYGGCYDDILERVSKDNFGKPYDEGSDDDDDVYNFTNNK